MSVGCDSLHGQMVCLTFTGSSRHLKAFMMNSLSRGVRLMVVSFLRLDGVRMVLDV